MKRQGDDEPMTRETYDGLSPLEQGYVSYMRGEWPGWDVPKTNPHLSGSQAAKAWDEGARRAVLATQDVDE